MRKGHKGLAVLTALAAWIALLLPAVATEVRSVTLPNGLVVAYREAGAGPRTMILNHGWSFSSAAWEKVLERTPAGWRFIAYDIRGFGDSGKPDSGYDYATLVADLDQFMTAKGVSRAVLAGHSLGSFFLPDFAAAHPDKVEALLLTSPQPRSMKLAMIEPIRVSIEQTGPAADRMSFFGQNTPRYFGPGALSPAETASFIESNMKAAPAALQETLRTAFSVDALPPDGLKVAGAIPTLVVVGSADIVPLAVVRQIMADAPKSCAAIVERAGHSSMWERPERWLELTMAFLDRKGGC